MFQGTHEYCICMYLVVLLEDNFVDFLASTTAATKAVAAATAAATAATAVYS